MAFIYIFMMKSRHNMTSVVKRNHGGLAAEGDEMRRGRAENLA